MGYIPDVFSEDILGLQLLLLERQKLKAIIKNRPPVAPNLSLSMLVPDYATKSQSNNKKNYTYGDQNRRQNLSILYGNLHAQQLHIVFSNVS